MPQRTRSQKTTYASETTKNKIVTARTIASCMIGFAPVSLELYLDCHGGSILNLTNIRLPGAKDAPRAAEAGHGIACHFASSPVSMPATESLSLLLAAGATQKQIDGAPSRNSATKN